MPLPSFPPVARNPTQAAQLRAFSARPGPPPAAPAARQRARTAPSRPPRGLCAPHAAKPARARLPAAAREEGSGSPRPGSTRRVARHSALPAPPRQKPAPRPPRHIAVFSPRPPGSGTAAARAAAFRCAPKGGSNPWAVPAGDRGPLSCEFSQNSGVGVLPQKSKSAALKRTAFCIETTFSGGCP